MGEFNLFDGVATVIILISAYFAYLRGVVREVMSVAGWLAAAAAAYFLAPQAVPLVNGLPLLGEYLTGSCELSIIVAFTLVFAATLMVCSLITALLAKLTSQPALGIINQGLGLIFGVIRGILVVAVILILHEAAFSGTQMLTSVSESGSATVFHDLQLRIQAQLPSNAASKLSVIYSNITAVCAGEAAPVPAESALPAEIPVQDDAPPPVDPPAADDAPAPGG